MWRFALGLLAGAVAVTAARKNKDKLSLGKVQGGLREAAVRGLGAVEASAGQLKGKLAEKPTEEQA
jgi:hypothetical protein